MKPRRPPPLATICLLVLGLLDACLLGAIVKSSFFQSVEASESVIGALDGAGEKKVPEVPGKQIAALGRTLATPAFFKSRAPYVPPAPVTVAAAPVAPVAPPPTVTVAGIVIDKRVKKALVVSPADNNGTWLNEGDQVMGWKVEAITAAGVTLRQNSSKLDVRMYPLP
ncbi:hypothetical protein HZZ13_36070 [Bradyrhizobium sp. CNPSo 4010]|uniref:General secretion pathway protein C n=1 Tax=Bradyrhizobium agreste TaxID=2751811 RepID=A0ABS0Q178_9BRAD|nr:hypothetical protein [Bradyrhizobium agreste]MBH5403173.1 hypothetical protein [Bradyrhizobium agreste]